MPVSKRSIINERAKAAKKADTYKKRTQNYRKLVRATKSKTEYLDKKIKKLDIIIAKIRTLGNFIAIFTGHNVKDSGKIRAIRGTIKKNKYEGLLLAKALFYKYGLEHKIPPKDLLEYVGARVRKQPANYRTNFTRSFKTNTDNVDIWLTFKQQYEEQPVLVNDFIDNRSTKQ
jgi:hypothetical protein